MSSPKTVHKFPYFVFQKKGTPCEQLEAAAKSLPKEPAESPRFWREIAGDKAYPLYQRRICMLQLFERHVRAGMKLGDVARISEAREWLRSKDIHSQKVLIGYLPFELSSINETFRLLILPDDLSTSPAVYIQIEGNMAVRDLYDVLSQSGGRNEQRARSILQLYISDPGCDDD